MTLGDLSTVSIVNIILTYLYTFILMHNRKLTYYLLGFTLRLSD
jgi:hypothetical protein